MQQGKKWKRKVDDAVKKCIFVVDLNYGINIRFMATVTLNKSKEKIIDWINPHSDKVTLEEYRSEMQAAEDSSFISFEEHKKNMNQWLTTKL